MRDPDSALTELRSSDFISRLSKIIQLFQFDYFYEIITSAGLLRNREMICENDFFISWQQNRNDR